MPLARSLLVVGLMIVRTAATAAADPEQARQPPHPLPTDQLDVSRTLDTHCFELSPNGRWSATPDLLCVGPGDHGVTIQLVAQPDGAWTTIATLTLDRTTSQCRDCNRDVYRSVTAVGPALAKFQVAFTGRRDRDGNQAGTVAIGGLTWFYRSSRSHPP